MNYCECRVYRKLYTRFIEFTRLSYCSGRRNIFIRCGTLGCIYNLFIEDGFIICHLGNLYRRYYNFVNKYDGIIHLIIFYSYSTMVENKRTDHLIVSDYRTRYANKFKDITRALVVLNIYFAKSLGNSTQSRDIIQSSLDVIF